VPDPKLQAVATEIQAILKRHDIGGIVHLAGKAHTHFLIEIAPSWSCARLESDNLVRVRALRKDFASPEAQKETVVRTAGMLLGFHTALSRTAQSIRELCLALGKQLEISHWDRLE
jgi:hypothetical protein